MHKRRTISKYYLNTKKNLLFKMLSNNNLSSIDNCQVFIKKINRFFFEHRNIKIDKFVKQRLTVNSNELKFKNYLKSNFFMLYILLNLKNEKKK